MFLCKNQTWTKSVCLSNTLNWPFFDGITAVLLHVMHTSLTSSHITEGYQRGFCKMLLEGILVPQWPCCWSQRRLQRTVWAFCYKPCFHSWPTQRHKMKVEQLVCGHPHGEITHERAAFTGLPLSFWVQCKLNSLLCESFAHLYIALTGV